MNNIEYSTKTVRTLPNLGETNSPLASEALNDRLSLKLNLSHMILGMGDELGEIVNCIGTELKHAPDLVNLKEEIGDMYWYLANYCNLRDIAPTIEIVNFLESHRCIELLISSIAELTSCVKRFLAYDKDLDKLKEMEAIYNIYSALDLLEKIYGLSGDEIRDKNIAKLFKRYPEKFSNEQAINRDTDEERKVLES